MEKYLPTYLITIITLVFMFFVYINKMQICEKRHVGDCRSCYTNFFLLVYFLSITVNSVKDPQVDCAVGVCRKAMSAFSYSWKKREEMADIQVELGYPHINLSQSPRRDGAPARR